MYKILLIFIFIVLALEPLTAFASCQTVTVMENGQVKVCTVCTRGSSTTVNCY